MEINNLKICILGLGYVGLPLALAFGKTRATTVGFDLNKERINELKKDVDRNGETSKDEFDSYVNYSYDEKVIHDSNFIIVCVPTPVDENNLPDFSFLKSASEIVGKNLTKNSVVVFESTVYPGATEEVCIPVIENVSGLKAGLDFFYGYSPERINPGDKKHTLSTVIKVVSGMDKKTADYIFEVYSLICNAGVYKAASIKVAEAAKVIENTQRDLNIALINELSMIFQKIGIDTKDVLNAASTKWNFLNFYPGLVGGHCVGVDPYYLIYKSKSLGLDPKVIGAGRKTNDSVPRFIVDLTEKSLKQAKKVIKGSNIMILGLTFKENVKDLRNSKVQDIIRLLRNKGANVFVYDPVVGKNELKDLGKKIDATIFCVAHEKLIDEMSLARLKKLSTEHSTLVDVKNIFNRADAEKAGFIYTAL